MLRCRVAEMLRFLGIVILIVIENSRGIASRKDRREEEGTTKGTKCSKQGINGGRVFQPANL